MLLTLKALLYFSSVLLGLWLTETVTEWGTATSTG